MSEMNGKRAGWLDRILGKSGHVDPAMDELRLENQKLQKSARDVVAEVIERADRHRKEVAGGAS